ncbi:MAG TPA: histidine kinase dimerization/phospho-acceptor domain-containing protein, partial [Candidatus Cloacimonadota bacterium]|nr:histidine kinase dimerization/phospho-acceptor domain-containing protein [Candidatus Cloacimonadota bacterium]
MKKRNEAMKEKSFLRYYALSLILLLLTINFYHLYKCQSSISNQLIQRYIKVLTNNMENELNSLQTEIEYLIQRQDLKALLKTNKIDASILNRIYLFLDKNNHLIQRLELYDDLSRRTFKRENDGEYLFSNIESHTDYIPLLAFNNIINNDNGVFEITIPLKNHESTTTANLKIIIRFNDYLDNQLHKYNKGNNNWCFVIDHEGQIISAFLDDKKITAKKISLLNLNSLRMAMDNQKTGVINHKIQYEKKKYNLLSNYATLNAYGYDHGIFVSLYKENIHWSILLNLAGLIIVLAYLIIILLQGMRKNKLKLKRTKVKGHEIETISLNLINDFPLSIVCYDDKNRIIMVNNRAKSLFMIQNLEEVIGEEIALLKNTALSSVLTQNSNIDTAFSTVFVIQNDEKRAFIKTTSQFSFDGQPLFLAIIADISNLELSTNANQGELQAKSDYLSIISHEIKTPLTSIIGYSELISSRNNDPDIAFFNN